MERAPQRLPKGKVFRISDLNRKFQLVFFFFFFLSCERELVFEERKKKYLLADDHQ